MLKYQIYQSKLKDSMSYGKWYARIVSTETMSLDGLADHMRSHNTPYSAGTIKGILEDAVSCIRELLLDGKRVQLDGLASFGLSIIHTYGAGTADAFKVRTNVQGVKLVAQGIGEFSKSLLTTSGRLSESNTYISPKTGTSTETPIEKPDPENPGGDTGEPEEPIETKYTVAVSASPTEGGTVSGGGQYTSGQQATLSAVANSGYKFSQWNDGNTSATRSVTVVNNASFIATFVKDAQSGGSGTEDGPTFG